MYDLWHVGLPLIPVVRIACYLSFMPAAAMSVITLKLMLFDGVFA